MRKLKFLIKLSKDEKLKLVKPSDDVCNAYIEKSNNSLKSARILNESMLYENSISMSYYAMYHSILALFFKCGIKCENHAATIILLKELFKEKKLFNVVSRAKKERVDKQYYIDFELTRNDSQELIKTAEDFTIQMRLLINKFPDEKIKRIRSELKEALKA